MLYFHCKIVNNYPGPNPGLGPRVNPGFGFEKPAGYPGLRVPGFGCPISDPQLYSIVRVVASVVKSDHRAVVVYADQTQCVQMTKKTIQ